MYMAQSSFCHIYEPMRRVIIHPCKGRDNI